MGYKITGCANCGDYHRQPHDLVHAASVNDARSLVTNPLPNPAFNYEGHGVNKNNSPAIDPFHK